MMQRRSTRRLAYKCLKLLGVEIPVTVEIGDDFHLPHGAVGVVISKVTKIGNNVKIFQGVTLGFADEYLPIDRESESIGKIVIEDDVVIGTGAKVMFKYGQILTVGKGAIIGANAVVLSSVPPGEIWAGIPARKVGVNPFARE